MNMRDFQKKSFLIKQEIIIEDDGKKSRSNLEIILPLAVFLLAGFGVLIIYTTRYSMPDGCQIPCIILKDRILAHWRCSHVHSFTVHELQESLEVLVGFLVISALILAAVFIFGYEVNYSKSWIDLKLFSAQPSELSKILLVLVTAAILSKWPRKKWKVSVLKSCIFLLAAIVPIVLILLEA